MDMIVLDTETTGVEAKRDSIIEIAAARVSNGKIVDQFQTLVKPANPLNVTVSVLTGIQPNELETAPDISEVREKLLEFVGDLPIVGHNISFDTDFLKSHGIDPSGHNMDTLDLAITLLPKVPFHSMQYLSKYLDLPNQPSHRAMSDVLATVDLINALIGLAQNIPANTLKNIRELAQKSDWEWSWVFDTDTSWEFTSSIRHSGLDPESRKENKQKQILNPNLTFGQSVQDDGVDKDSGRSQNDNTGNMLSVQDDRKGTVLGEIKPGFNVFELPPDMPQMAANINLVKNDSNSILVVSNDVFQKSNWETIGLSPYFGSVLQLDAERFNFLVNKPKIKSTDFKLIIKILLTGYPEKSFNPNDTYLTKDEFYLWEQKLAPFQFQAPTFLSVPIRHAELDSASPEKILKRVQDDEEEQMGGWVGLSPKTVMSFASFYEILDNNPDILKDKHIYLPQWVEFDEWATNKSAKIFTSLYVNAIVASRRDFVHDFVSDNKQADELFKSLNNLGSELADWWGSVEELWGEQAAGSAVEISSLLVADKTGKAMKLNAEKAMETLVNYLEKLKSVSIENKLAQQKQIEHTTNLLGQFNLLTHPGQKVKNYLNGYNDRVILSVVGQPVPNIWQSPPNLLASRRSGPLAGEEQTLNPPLLKGRRGGVGLKGLNIIIASNGILVNGKPDFISALLGEPIVVSRLAGQQVSGSANEDGAKPNSSPAQGGHALSSPPARFAESRRARGGVGGGGSEQSKPITFVSGLPDRNRDENYQSEIFDYLVKQVINPKNKTLIIFPNVAMMAEFFEMYHPILSREARHSPPATAGHPESSSVIPTSLAESRRAGVEGSHINLFSQNVAGNVEMLKDKMAPLDGFTLLISGTNLPKFLPVVDGLDKTVFLTMPFDIPGSLSNLLAKDRFRNEFADYGLPKAIAKFKVNLAELYSKTNEIYILDSRLISTDWGQTLPKSLSGFQVNKI